MKDMCNLSYRESHSLCKFPGEAIIDSVMCSSLWDLVLINDLTQLSTDLLGLGDGLDCLMNWVLGLRRECRVRMGTWMKNDRRGGDQLERGRERHMHKFAIVSNSDVYYSLVCSSSPSLSSPIADNCSATGAEWAFALCPLNGSRALCDLCILGTIEGGKKPTCMHTHIIERAWY